MRHLLIIIALLISVNSYGADWIINGQAGHKDYIAQPGTGGPVTGAMFSNYTSVDRVKVAGNAINLSAATGNEVAYTLDYTTNKATSGNDNGLLIKMTDTASPGTSYPLEVRTGATGATSVFSVDNTGTVLLNSASFASGGYIRVPSNAGLIGNGNNVTVNVGGLRSWSTAGTSTNLAENTHTESSGASAAVAIKPTWSQTGTATATDLLINRTETSNTTSGAQLLADFQVGGVSKFKVDNTGTITTAVGKPIIVLAQSAVASSVTNSTAETTLATYVLPAGIMGLNGAVRITTQWKYTGSTNSKALRVKFGGTTVISASGLTNASYISAQLQRTIINRNSASSQALYGTSSWNSYTAAETNALISGTENTANAVTITITGQCAALGETITLEGYTIELLPGAN